MTLALPQDVQTRLTTSRPVRSLALAISRQPPELEAMARAAAPIRGAHKPIVIAGGGVLYSEATTALQALVDAVAGLALGHDALRRALEALGVGDRRPAELHDDRGWHERIGG